MLGYTKVIAPLSGRAGLRQVDQGNIIRASDLTGLVIITQLQPIAVQFSLPQQQIVRVNAAAGKGALLVDVFGNDGVTVVDTGTLKGIDNQVDPTTGTLKLKAEFPNGKFQLWPGQFVNVRLKVETLDKAIVVPTSAVQRGPAGTFSYVIGAGDIATAKPIVVTQQNENDAVIASGLTTSDRVVTTGFANLSDGAKVFIGKDDAAPSADLAPRKRSRAPDAKSGDTKSGDAKGGAGKDGKRGEGDQKGQTGPAAAPDAADSSVRRQPDTAAFGPHPRHRRAAAGGPARDHPRSGHPPATPAVPADLRQGEPGRRAGADARADVGDDLAARDERH